MRWLSHIFLFLLSAGFLFAILGIIAVVSIVSFYSQGLPDHRTLTDYKPPVVTRVHAGDGRILGEFAQERRIFMPIDEIPETVRNAFIAAEDQNFYSHNGVDYFAIARASVVNIRNVLLKNNKRLIGASTITQQVAKNFFLSNEVAIKRKVKEAILASRIERVLTKDQILELYLNEIFLGNRSYGVAAAALNYFNKPLDAITIEEAAYLGALPKAPSNYHPVDDYDAALARRDWVISRMAAENFITEDQAEIATRKPLRMIARNTQHIIEAPYFAETVRRELLAEYGEEGLYKGGLSVRTSVDPEMQKLATHALRQGLESYDHRHGYRGPVTQIPREALSDPTQWKAALREVAAPDGLLPEWHLAVVMDVQKESASIGFTNGETGKVLRTDTKWARKYYSVNGRGPVVSSLRDVFERGDVIMVEPKTQDDAKADKKAETYILKQIPKVQGGFIALDPHTGRVLAMQGGWRFGKSQFNRVTQAKRQPGSAIKPFVYLAALENGFTPATLILDSPIVIEDRPGHFWKPENYKKDFAGPTPLRRGVEKSKNLMTVRLADYIGMETVATYVRDFGIDPNMKPLLSYALGAGETTLHDMTAAYAKLVNGGKYIRPTFVDRIQDRYGRTIFRHDQRPCAECGALVRWNGQLAPKLPDHRQQIADMRHVYQMVSILSGVVERGTGVRLRSLHRPMGGKTGTTNDSKDAWFIGFTPDLVAGVYVGFDQPQPLGKRETGSSVALPVFKTFMEDALEGVPPKPFRVPSGVRMVRINAETGQRAKSGDESVIWEAFTTGSEPDESITILESDGIRKMSKIPTGDTTDPTASASTGTGGIY
jgi:penicillin-binding protein 1A